MKKVKVKTKQKQKQKQSQTVNINLGELLKKSKPRRKTQPKQHNISQPISFNAPPIREYIDTSFSNQVSRLDNPLLARTTINPIIEGTTPPQNVVGPIQPNPQKSENPLFQAQKKEPSITDEFPIAQGYLMEDLPQYVPKFDLNKKPSSISPDIKAQQNQLKKEEALRKKEEKKEEALRKKEEKQSEALRKKEEKQSEALRKKEEKKALQKKEDTSSQTDILTYVTKPSVSIKKDIQTYSVKPEESQAIFIEPEQQKTIFSAPQEQENITSSLEQAMLDQAENPPMTEEELAFNRLITKAPSKKRPPIVARPIKLDPVTGEPIKKEKKPKLDPNIGKTFIVQPPV